MKDKVIKLIENNKKIIAIYLIIIIAFNLFLNFNYFISLFNRPVRKGFC